MRYSQLAVVLLLVGASDTTLAKDRPTLLVTDIDVAAGVSDGIARMLGELAISEFGRSGSFEVIGGSDLQAMITNDQQKLLLGCTDVSCLAEIGGALDTDYIAVATIGRIGDSYLISVKVIDVRASKVTGRSTLEIEADDSELTGTLRAAIKKSMANIVSGKPGTEAARAKMAQEARLGTVGVESGKASGATVPPVGSEPASGIGRLLPWIGLGVFGAVAVVGTVLLGVAPSESSIRQNEYQAYIDASMADKGTRYADVEAAVSGRNSTLIAGYVLVGVGAAGAVASLVAALMMGGDSAPVEATVAPGEGGATLLLRGSF